MGSFLASSVNEDANTANCKYCTKCPNKEGENKSLKNVAIPNPNLLVTSKLFLKEQTIKQNKLLQKQKVMYSVTLLDQT